MISSLKILLMVGLLGQTPESKLEVKKQPLQSIKRKLELAGYKTYVGDGFIHTQTKEVVSGGLSIQVHVLMADDGSFSLSALRLSTPWSAEAYQVKDTKFWANTICMKELHHLEEVLNH